LAIIIFSGAVTLGTAPLVFSQSDENTPQFTTGIQSQNNSQNETQQGTAATQDQIQQAQQQLKDKGIYAGAVDGNMNSQFTQALRDYQASNQLESTGTLDQQTMSLLGISQSTTERAKPDQSEPAAGDNANKENQGGVQSQENAQPEHDKPGSSSAGMEN